MCRSSFRSTAPKFVRTSSSGTAAPWCSSATQQWRLRAHARQNTSASRYDLSRAESSGSAGSEGVEAVTASSTAEEGAVIGQCRWRLGW